MTKSKIITISLAIIIGILVLYLLLAGINSHKEIKKLTQAIEQKVDSLEVIRLKYDSLEAENNEIINELSQTRQSLQNFKYAVDSISALRIRNIASLNKALNEVIKKQQELEKLNVTDSTFRFN